MSSSSPRRCVCLLALLAAALGLGDGCRAPGPGKKRLKAARLTAEAAGMPKLVRYPGAIVEDALARPYDSLSAIVYRLSTRDAAELVLAHYRQALSGWQHYEPYRQKRKTPALGFRSPSDRRIVVIEVMARRARATDVSVICIGADW